MFYHYNDYLIPVLIGRSACKISKAKDILRKRKVRPQIFAVKFSFFQRLLFDCHSVRPGKKFWIFQNLISYAEALDEYYTPAIIICDDADRAFLNKYSCELEKYYILIDFDDYITEDLLEKEENKNDDTRHYGSY